MVTSLWSQFFGTPCRSTQPSTLRGTVSGYGLSNGLFSHFSCLLTFFTVTLVLTHQLSNCFCVEPELCYLQKFQTLFFVLFIGVADC